MAKRKSCTLAAIVRRFGGELIGDPAIRVERVATLQSARATDISFLAQPRYLPQLEQTRAGAVIVGPASRDATTTARIVCDQPYLYFARVSAFFNPPPPVEPGRHKSAVIERSARIARSASVGACAVIGRGARIGDGAVIGAGCFIGDGAVIGAATRLHANVTVYHDCSIGARCILHSGVVIGADGFGIARDNGGWTKIPQTGRVLIGDDVEIGANTTIDRGALDDTVIEDGVKLDNQIQVAHNVHIGAHTAIAACTGIAGSARIGRNCAIGGAARIAGHVVIADNVNVSTCTLIMKSLPREGTYTGAFPSSTHESWLRNAAHLRQLDDLVKRLRRMERLLEGTEREK